MDRLNLGRLAVVVVAGSAVLARGQSCGHWEPLGAVAGTPGSIYAMTEFGGELIAGGTFTIAGGVPVNRIAAWNGSSWRALGNGIEAPPAGLRSSQPCMSSRASLSRAGFVPTRSRGKRAS